MHSEKKKKLSLLLAAAVGFSALVPGVAPAVSSKAATVDSYVDIIKSNKNTTASIYTSLRPYASYSVSVSDKSVAEYIGFFNDAFQFNMKKNKTFKVTIHETIGSSTAKLTTVTVNPNTNNSDYYYLYSSYDTITIQKGDSITANALFYASSTHTLDLTCADDSIVSVNNKNMVTANEVGTTVITATFADTSDAEATVTVNVVDSVPGRNVKAAKTIKSICTTKVTAKNAKATLNKISKLGIGFASIINYDGQVLIPSQYVLSDIQEVAKKCAAALGNDYSAGGVSLEVASLKSLKGNVLTVNLTHAITDSEFKALGALFMQDYYEVRLMDENGYEYPFFTQLKKGAKTLDLVYPSYNGKLPKGQYYAHTSNHKKNKLKVLSVKKK